MYKEITVETTREGADFISDAFFSMGANGVKITDSDDVKNLTNWDYMDDSLLSESDTVTVSGFVAEEETEKAVAEIGEYTEGITGIDFGSLNITVTDVNPTDWYSEWRKYYKPIEADGFVVVPEWQEYENKDNKIIIKIDPSMAFGTGEHESTKLMLKLISGVKSFEGLDVVDVGTGSGILGIAAAKRGAGRVYMCDTDSLAVKSAKENAERNFVSQATEIVMADLLNGCPLKADVMLANLTADLLIRLLSSGAAGYLKDGGVMLVSGIITQREKCVTDAFAENGFTVREKCAMGEWTAFAFSKTGK